MTASSLSTYHVRATVTAVELKDPYNFDVWIRRHGAADDSQPIPVIFQRAGEHVNATALETVEQLEPGDAVEVEYTQIGDGALIINRGRSITKR